MTKDEIIKMAKEAGFRKTTITNAWFRFAELVAEAEREACAKVCEDNADDLTDGDWDNACINCADHIRDRSTN